MTTAAARHFTHAEYLAWEREQEKRHELCRGELIDVPGGSPRHNALSAVLIALLYQAFRGSGVTVFSPDQRIYVPQTDHFVYGDVSVARSLDCLSGTRDVILNPILVAEVLSPSTESYARGPKWQSYRSIESLLDYLLVSQDIARIEHFARTDAGGWLYRVAEAGGKLRLAAGPELDVDSIYEGLLPAE